MTEADGADPQPPRSVADGVAGYLQEGFAIAGRKIDPALRDELAERVLAHLVFHTASRPQPAVYQFELPNGGLLTASDHYIASRRRLGFEVPQGPERLLLTTAAWAWPRRHPDQGAWFSWPLSDRARRRILKRIAYSVRSAYVNRPTERHPWGVVIDPRSAPAPLPPEPRER